MAGVRECPSAGCAAAWPACLPTHCPALHACTHPQVTHLIVGDERRTLKLMLAVAAGAWLVSPQWVTASLEAGRWLPESQFPAKVFSLGLIGWLGGGKQAGRVTNKAVAWEGVCRLPTSRSTCWVPAKLQVRFEAAAARARALLEVPDAPPLLGDHSIYVHLPDRAKKLMAANAAALKRVALALGAKVRLAPQGVGGRLGGAAGGGARVAAVAAEWTADAHGKARSPRTSIPSMPQCRWCPRPRPATCVWWWAAAPAPRACPRPRAASRRSGCCRPQSALWSPRWRTFGWTDPERAWCRPALGCAVAGAPSRGGG